MFDHEAEEAALFLDMLPLLATLVESRKDGENDTLLIQQAASVVIEQFVRSFCLPLDAPKSNMPEFERALGSMALSMDYFASSLSNMSFEEWAATGMVVQTACSLAICAASLIRLLKARCISILPRLMKSTRCILSAANNCGSSDVTLKSYVELVQVSAVRLFTTVADSLPKFMVPYLGALLAPSLLVPLHAENDTAGVAGMEKALSKKVPTRQLVPAICKEISVSCKSDKDYDVLLSLLQMSLENTERADLSTVSSHIVKALFKSYESGQIDSSNTVMLTMIMKLSEAQLKPIYMRFYEWQSVSSKHKMAFWSLSASLAKELKFLFLPCLSPVADDAINELQLAVSILSRRKQGKSKKTKVGSVEDLAFLPQMLVCLGNAFQADARQGGSWIRENNDQRYHSFMEPLAQLLHSKVPSDFPFTDESDALASPYQRLVVTSLIPTLVSLSAAAGNDTLWKPLNHSVLQACDDENSAEVPRAGLKCLHSLMKTLGEEYMVLLPECLPTLSELLEADETTAQMARDCVSLAEDLLGESLEDSLR
mmetsp:Transcript_4389/g.6528  ORF Transcript_4389/g.6528 Transcript_4389/m.6528 type:complete len:541 (+) Transcript_4389:1150-2772(+)